MPRRLAAGELAAHLEWLRAAIRDPNLNTRLVLGGILDVLVAVAGLLPAPPPPRTPTAPTEPTGTEPAP